MVGVAVKVTDVPAHIAPAGLAAIVTEGVMSGLTSIVIVLLLAFVGEAQRALLVRETLIMSLSARVVLE